MELNERLLKRLSNLEQDFQERASKFQQIAEYLSPRRANFFGARGKSDDKREMIFDSVPEEAAQNLSAAIHTLLTPSTLTWLTLDLIQKEEFETDEGKEWLNEVARRMISKFNSEDSGFHPAASEFYDDLPKLGTSGFFVDEIDGKIRFLTIPLNEFRIAENSRGQVDTFYRTFQLTARQIEQNEKWKLPTCVTDAKDEPDRKFTIVHVIEPRKDFKDKPISGKEMPIASYYIEKSSKEIMFESGYNEMPVMAPRWSKIAGEVYGSGIGEMALPDIRVLNEMAKTALIASEKQGDPITLLPHDGFIGEYSSDGGATNFYRGTGNIRDRVMTIGSEADLNAILAMVNSKQDSIRRMFLNDKLQSISGPQMTATEVIAIQNERMRILGPVLSRLQSEFLAPLVTRVFGIMLRNGELPQIPEEMANQEIKIQYVSPISRSQKQTEAESFGQALNFMIPMIQVAGPGILDNFDFDKIARDTQELFGYPSKYLKADKIVKQGRQAQAEAAQKQAQMQEASQIQELQGQAAQVRNEQTATE